jgi:RNA polymerase sigma-70 factor (ECF subfamily)
MMHTVQQQVSDEELAVRGDLVALHERYSRRLVVFLANQGGTTGEPEDLAQEVWLRVHRRLSSGPPFEGHFRGFLFSIARNLHVDHGRQKRPGILLDGAAIPGNAEDPVEGLIRSEELLQLQRCLEQLPPHYAEVLRQTLSGMKPAVIAKTVQLDVDRVYRRVHDAKHSLLECLKRGTR